VERSADERVRDLRRLLEAARQVYANRSRLVPAIVASTGLSPQGVELGFESLERDAADEDLRSLIQAAGSTRHVHVVLSANVFVAPLRAIALALGAAPRVTVRASPRDPALARALVEAAGDPRITLTVDRDVAATEADVVHVYGRDATIAEVRARVRAGVRVLGHGAGLGAALVTGKAPVGEAARALALDVAVFDQRGCLSPRLVMVVGDQERASEVAERLHAELGELDMRLPRGVLSPEESSESVRWRDTVTFAGALRVGGGHTVGILPGGASLAIPPAGRHVLVVPVRDLAEARRALAVVAPLVVTLGSDDPVAAAAVAPAHARTAELGAMQRPPLDGPVDRRTALDAIAVT